MKNLQIRLDEDDKKREGDTHLLYTLSNYLKKTKNLADKFEQKVIELWVDFIHKIGVEAVSSNKQGRSMKLVFDFPVEEEFTKRFPELSKG